MTKLAIIPCTVFIQTSFYGKVYNPVTLICEP
jgi:hypothetical protein